MQKLRRIFPQFIHALLNSYTQIFFSNNRIFGLVIMVVSFFDFYAGLSGLASVIIANVMAYLIGFNRFNIRSGYYGFNSLLVGLGLGVYYSPGIPMLFILFFASLMTLMITVSLEGVIGKYGLPYLSIPFLIGIWVVTLAVRQFGSIEISERGVYSLNEMYTLGGLPLVNIYEWFGNIKMPLSLLIYFRSVGAIFFQYHLVPGLIIALGLIYYSRIAFLLSLLGFYSAFLYYHFIGANFYELSYGYIGFNFILTSIAVGGFFVVSSRYSFLWVILLTPVISFLITASGAIFGAWQLSVFSLPFNAIVLMFLYTMKFRERFYLKPEMVLFQLYSPEKNLYSQVNNKNRFKNTQYFPISLPFFGAWTVRQGHNGEHTHKGDWKHAWDFEILDDKGSAYKNNGLKAEDYYCFNKPVIAPADGYIVDVVDYHEDNEIGNMDIEHNWGNTIVIKHLEGLFTKMSHLEKGSIKINKGDYVKKGDVIAAVGNSGRSPLPHLHFQVQATPYIGSKTLDYPLGNYIRHAGEAFIFMSYDRPDKDEVVSNVWKNETLSKTFNLVPGQKLNLEIQGDKGKISRSFEWEVLSDLYNFTYIYCRQTESKAYFRNDGDIFYFTHFEGNKRSLLFAFYLANFKVLLGFYKNMQISDTLSPSEMNNKFLLLVQDFIAPFLVFLKSVYTLKYLHIEDDFGKSQVQLHSKVEARLGKWILKQLQFEIKIENDRFEHITIIDKDRRLNIRETGTN